MKWHDIDLHGRSHSEEEALEPRKWISHNIQEPTSDGDINRFVLADYQSQQDMELRFSQMATLYDIKLSANTITK